MTSLGRGKGRPPPQYFLVEVQVEVPHGASVGPYGGGGASLLRCRRVLASDLEGGAGKPLVSADAVERGWWGALGVTRWWRVKAEFSAWLLWLPSLARMELYWFFGMVCLEWDHYCIAVSIS